MKKLTEPQAWRRIAKSIADPSYVFDGLCHETNKLQRHGRITPAINLAMEKRIDHWLDDQDRMSGTCYAYFQPCWTTPEDPDNIGEQRSLRVMIALVMAHESKDET